MCTVTINIDEAQVRKVYPSLTDIESITRWAQHLVDACIADLTEADYPLPEGVKPYTIEEVNAMLDAAEAEIAAGIGIPNEVVMREWKEDIARWEAEEEAQKKAIAYVEEANAFARPRARLQVGYNLYPCWNDSPRRETSQDPSR